VSDLLDRELPRLPRAARAQGLGALARVIHEPSAATPPSPASAGLLSLRALDDLPEVVSAPLGREALHLQTFATLRSNPHE
jgi:hypothetical protein